MRRVIVRIDRLVLRGFPHDAGYEVAEALRAAVAEQLATATPPGVDPPQAVARIDGGTLRVAAGTAPALIGAQAGRAIARHLGPR